MLAGTKLKKKKIREKTKREYPNHYEQAIERWSPVQSVEKILISVVSMLAGMRRDKQKTKEKEGKKDKEKENNNNDKNN